MLSASASPTMGLFNPTYICVRSITNIMTNDLRHFLIKTVNRNLPKSARQSKFYICINVKFSFNLVRTNINYNVVRPPFFFKMTILSMHLLLRMNVMLDCICMGSVDLPGSHGKQNKNKKKNKTKQKTKWEILANSGTWIDNLEIRRQIL